MNNLEKEFIPQEQALALKELGFNEPCFGFYIGDIIRLTLYTDCGWKNSTIPYDTQEELLTAPLYQQSFRWLLNLLNKNEHFSNKWTISYNEDYFSLFLGGCNMGVFKKELECLKKLIEIVKNAKK